MSKSRRGLTMIDLLALITIAEALLAILMPAIQSHRESARRAKCASNFKMLGLGIMNHHDVFKFYPRLTEQGNSAGTPNVYATSPGATFKPGTDEGYSQKPARAAGYSWRVRILPYMEEYSLYLEISRASNKFQLEAFTPVDQGFFMEYGGAKHHFATVDLELLHCPAYGGPSISTASSGTAKPAVEIKSYAALYNGNKKAPFGVQTSNYVALSATHVLCMSDPDSIAKAGELRAEPPNGVIVPEMKIKQNMILDGMSKTLVLCETKEPAVNSWYDGTVAWTVGQNPNGKQPLRAAKNAEGRAGAWSADGGTTAINYGPQKDEAQLFAPKGTTASITQPVSWGPSSDHGDGVVLHLAADGSVYALTSEIDPTLYLQLITRAGLESAEMPEPYKPKDPDEK